MHNDPACQVFRPGCCRRHPSTHVPGNSLCSCWILARGTRPSSACGTFSPLVAGRRATGHVTRENRVCCPSPLCGERVPQAGEGPFHERHSSRWRGFLPSVASRATFRARDHVRTGTVFAALIVMSRVEPNDQPREQRQAQPDRRTAPRRTPGLAEGDERTIDEALRNQERRHPEE